MKILFVCTGNICRSPLAQAVFNHQLKALGIVDRFETESAGTHAYHVGENADQRMRQTADSHGVRLNHPARLVQAQDLRYYDLILGMGDDHVRHLQRMAQNDAQSKKIQIYRFYDPMIPRESTVPDVPDPYYDDREAFEQVYSIVERTSQALVRSLLETTGKLVIHE
jgi:protein-tyrosine phosphatase